MKINMRLKQDIAKIQGQQSRKVWESRSEKQFWAGLVLMNMLD